MYCNKCGRQLPENSRFCDGCGAAQVKESPAVKPVAPKTEKKQKRGNPILLVIGIVLFLVGAWLGGRYDNAKASGYEVTAVITEVVEREETDSEGGYSSTSYTLYGDYTVDGKTYTNKRLGKWYSQYFVGDTVTVVVDPENPGRKMPEGGMFAVGGFALAVVGLVSKKKEEEG